MRTFVCNKVKGNLRTMQEKNDTPHQSGRTTQLRFTEDQRLEIQAAATKRGMTGGSLLPKYIKEVVQQALVADGVKNI